MDPAVYEVVGALVPFVVAGWACRMVFQIFRDAGR